MPEGGRPDSGLSGGAQFRYAGSSLVVGTAWMGVAAIAAALSGFAAAALLTRHWGPQRYGQYAALVAWGTVVSVLADGGLAQVLSREGAHKLLAIGSLHRAALRRRIGISLLALVLAILTLSLGGQAVPSLIALAAVCVSLQLDLALDLALTLWRVVGRYRTAALWRIARRACYLGAAALTVYLGFGVTGAAVLILLSGLPFAVAANRVALTRTRETGGLAVDLPWVATGLFWLAGVLYWVYFQADQVLLALLADETQLGLYAPAVAVAAVLLMLTTVAAEVVLPRLFHIAAQPGTGTEVGRRTLAQVPLFAALAGLVAVGFALHADRVTRAVFGAAFEGTAPLLAILSFFVALRYLSVPAFLALQYIDRLRQLVTVQATAAVVNVGLNVVLIRAQGARGAAFATLVSEMIMLIGVWAYVPRHWHAPALRSAMPHLVIAAGIFGADAYLGRGEATRLGLVVLYVLLSGAILAREASRFVRGRNAVADPE